MSRRNRNTKNYNYAGKLPHYAFEHTDGRKMRFYREGMGYTCLQISVNGLSQRVQLSEEALTGFMTELDRHGWAQVSVRAS